MYNNKSLEQIYRELALYKYILINFENIQIKEIEDVTNSINTNKIILEPYFQEIFGIKLLTLGNFEKADYTWVIYPKYLKDNDNYPPNHILNIDNCLGENNKNPQLSKLLNEYYS